MFWRTLITLVISTLIYTTIKSIVGQHHIFLVMGIIIMNIYGILKVFTTTIHNYSQRRRELTLIRITCFFGGIGVIIGSLLEKLIRKENAPHRSFIMNYVIPVITVIEIFIII